MASRGLNGTSRLLWTTRSAAVVGWIACGAV